MVDPTLPARRRRRARVAGAAVATTVLSLCAQAPAVHAQSAATTAAVDLAVTGLGGERALSGLDSFRLVSSGRTFIFDEGPEPGDTVSPASTFTATLDYDLAGSRLRADSVRTSLGTDRRVSEVITGRRGFISGADANFAPPADKPMTSDRWAAITREQRLLNPVLYVRPLAGAARAGVRARDAARSTAAAIACSWCAATSCRSGCYVDARTGRISRLVTEDHNYNRGDVRTVVDYRGWRRRRRRGLPAARSRSRQAGQVLHAETRSAVADQPGDRRRARSASRPASRATYDAELAARGARTTEWLMTFAHLGFIKDGPATQIAPRVVAPGSTLIQGIANQTMIVEQQDGIVVVEGALSSPRAEALIAYIEATYPGKPIRYVTGSHHHADHSGGMRPFVALGARPVVHEAAVPFFERVFAARGSRAAARPARRQRRAGEHPRRPGDRRRSRSTIRVRPVDGARRADRPRDDHDPRLRADARACCSSTATRTRPRARPARARGRCDETIRGQRARPCNWIVGGHGGVISYADFQTAIATP